MKLLLSICIVLLSFEGFAQGDSWKEEIDKSNDLAWKIAESKTVEAYQLSYESKRASIEKEYTRKRKAQITHGFSWLTNQMTRES